MCGGGGSGSCRPLCAAVKAGDNAYRSGVRFDPEEFLDKLCEEAMSIQREKLREILGRNAEVEYLQRPGLGGRTDVESFDQAMCPRGELW
jgi:hypothetical protein